MNKLLDETIRRLEKELLEAKELKKRSKENKKPVQIHEVKKIIENIKNVIKISNKESSLLSFKSLVIFSSLSNIDIKPIHKTKGEIL